MPPRLKVAPKVPARRGGAAAAPAADPAPAPAPETASEPTTATESASATEAAAALAEAVATPAPEQKPLAPPKGRLDSLAPRGRGAGARVGLKVAPKVVARRTKEEREQLDAKFQASKASEDAGRPRGGSTRGARGGRGRGGRGGFGRDREPELMAGASGPFALGSIVSAGGQKVISERVYGSGRPGKFSMRSQKARVKREGAAADGAADGPGYSSSEESDGQRMDVEYISLLDEASDDEDGEGKADADWGSGAPVRVQRREHVYRQAMVNTDSSSRKGKAVEQERAKEMVFDTEIRIKEEPLDDDAVMLPSSPDTKRRVKPPHSPETQRKKSDLHVGTSPRARRRSSSGKKKPVISTAEEREEFERGERDRLFSLQELGGALDDDVAGKGKEKQKTEDAEGDVAMADAIPAAAAAAAGVNRNAETENQIFFFQLPQLLPVLAPVSDVKSEDTKDAANPAANPAATANPADAVPADVKPPKKPLSKKAAYKEQLAALSAVPPSGRVGKLRVHKSGRVSLLWGGTHPDESTVEMEVNRGAGCEFLQEVVVVKQESPYGDADVDEKGQRKGVAYSLGQVKGKYVVNPDFGKLIAATGGSGRRRRAAGGVKKEEKREGEGEAVEGAAA
ncbi:RNA polymerase III RPC4-domain-containing protein [Geopyxis carbonaria]|nr:RNA polymerase III RPC4-domain-containing protein [Geopyxis carbonaria]